MRQSFKAGDVIIRQGSYETSAYIIESGRVEVSIMVNDKKTVFAILGKKQIFGEMALMDDKPVPRPLWLLRRRWYLLLIVRVLTSS